MAEVLSGYVIGSAAMQSTVGWASRPSSFPRTRESRLAPESKSGVTNDRQDAGPTDEIAWSHRCAEGSSVQGRVPRNAGFHSSQ